MSLIQPGHTSLNMKDVSDDLAVVHHHVRKLDINKRRNNSIDEPVLPDNYNQIVAADDVDLVHHAPADSTAISTKLNKLDAKNIYGIDPTEYDARTTVRNSVYLNGKPDTDYMSSKDGGQVKQKTDTMAINYGEDIASIRQELYEIKHKLEKSGLLHLTNEHFGYNDTFRNGYKPYEWQDLGSPTIDPVDSLTLRLVDTAVSQMDVGDYIVIYYKDEQRIDVPQIKEIKADGQTIVLDEGMTGANLKKENIVVYKSYGVSKDGNFYFAKDVEYKLGSDNIWTGFDDDTMSILCRPVAEKRNSYAFSFRIPESKLGFLTTLRLYVHAIGNPTLTAYIFDEQDVKYFRNPVQAEALYRNGDLDSDGEPKMHFFAKSIPLNLDPTKGEEIVSFNFWNDDKDSYPLILRKDTPTNRVRYVCVIVGTFTDDNNYANIRFLQSANKTPGNLEYNNVVYRYEEQPDSSAISAFSIDENDNNKDIYYEVIMREAVEDSMIAMNRGLYSALLESPKNMPVSRARATLRIKREGGLWDSVTKERNVYGTMMRPSFPVEVFKNFPNKKATFRTADPLGLTDDLRIPMELRENNKFTEHPKTIIGNNITTATVNATNIVPAEPSIVKPDDPVYRLAYRISVKGKKHEYNSMTGTYVVTDQKKIFLNPIAVIPDGCKDKDDVYSDRIVFEGDFRDENGNPLYFDELEYQVFWQKPAFSDNIPIADEQMGIMHDLVFSIDRTI